eukprot:scaffold421138_cov31-Attheya_sp.AAC.1
MVNGDSHTGGTTQRNTGRSLLLKFAILKHNVSAIRTVSQRAQAKNQQVDKLQTADLQIDDTIGYD